MFQYLAWHLKTFSKVFLELINLVKEAFFFAMNIRKYSLHCMSDTFKNRNTKDTKTPTK